jgi:Zn-dependent metalloprotease
MYDKANGILESLADVFASMIKQYNGGDKPQLAVDADWLIGQGIFNKALGVEALRSLKAPGTAYVDSPIGTDPQTAHMKDYKDWPDTAKGDFGGVHINSGIPSKAFQLVATGLGGYSWDIAGKIWYDVLLDTDLRSFAAKSSNWQWNCFLFFAALTIKHAKNYQQEGSNLDVSGTVTQAWQAVGVKPATLSWSDDWGCAVL